MARSYWIETWGCQMNEHDSDRLAGALEALGYAPAPSAFEAAVVLLNTCAIRDKAEAKVFHFLDRLRPVVAAHPETIVGVCGCVAQLAGRSVIERAPFVRLVLGPRAGQRLGERLEQLEAGQAIVDTALDQEDDGAASSLPPRGTTSGAKAFVTVMEGCNKACSYCVVPATRGREQSRSLVDVLAEVEQLAARGRREIEFLGQNVNAWRCPASGAGLAELLRAAGGVRGLARIRFTTSHPAHLDRPIIQALADAPAVCNALHLPVQSGSTRVLKLMRRGYTREHYLAIVDELRSARPDLALSTDVIVGFPGETDADFEETLTLLEQVRFDQLYSFVFSPRPGTAAARLRDDTPTPRKCARLIAVQGLQRRIQQARHGQLVGRTLEVLVEGPSRRNAAEWAGRTTCNRVVNFGSATSAPGDIVQIRVVAAGPNSLRGELIAPLTTTPTGPPQQRRLDWPPGLIYRRLRAAARRLRHGGEEAPMQVEMRIQGLMIDPITNMPIVVLRDPRTDAKLPIWVGVFEANAIALELEKIDTPRPMTHDLLRALLLELGARLVRVAVTNLQDNTFYALLHLETPSGPKEIDARPSDAIALALRCEAPIFVNREVIEAAQHIDLTQGHQDTERFREWLESLEEEDLGRYEV